MLWSLLTVSLQVRIIIRTQWGPRDEQRQEMGLRVQPESGNETNDLLSPCSWNPRSLCTCLTYVDRRDCPTLTSALSFLGVVSCDLVCLSFGSMVGKPSYHSILEDGEIGWFRDCIPRNRIARRRCRMTLPSGHMLEQSYGGESREHSPSPLDIPKLSGNSKHH